MKLLFALLVALLSILYLIFLKPVWSAVLRFLFLLLLLLLVLNPSFRVEREVFPRIAVVVDASRSALHLKDFYIEQIRDMDFPYELFALGDSILSLKDIRDMKPQDGTNINVLSELYGFDYIVFMGDGWHNAPEEVNFSTFPSPVLVIMPPDDSTGIHLRSITYPRNVEPGDDFRIMIALFSSRDTSLPISISLSDTIRDELRIVRGENRFLYSLKSPSKEGNYTVRLNIGKDRRNLPLYVHSTKRYVLIRVGYITPEVGLLKRLIESYNLDTRILLDSVVIKDAEGQLAFTVSFFSDTSGDLVYTRGYVRGDTVLYNNGELPVIVEKSGKVVVLTDTLWRTGRRDFEAYAAILRPALDRIFARKPFVRITHDVSGNLATVKVISRRDDIQVKFNDTLSLSRTWTGVLERTETVRVEVLSSLGDRILTRSIVLSPARSERENETGIDSLMLARLASRTGGALLRSVSQLNDLIKLKHEIREIYPFRSVPFILLSIFLFVLDVFLRRRFGYR